MGERVLSGLLAMLYLFILAFEKDIRFLSFSLGGILELPLQ